MPLKVASADSWRLTIEEAKARAFEENRTIAIARERLSEIRGMKGEAMAVGLPAIVGSATYQRAWRRPQIIIGGQAFRTGTENTYVAQVELNQLLFDGGRLFRAVRAAKTEEARGREDIKNIEAQIRFQVKQTFYEILYTDKVIAVLDQELKEFRSLLNTISVRYRQGLESDYALMRQEVQVSNIEPLIYEAKRNRELLTNGMKILLAIPQGDEFIPVGKFDYRARALPEIAGLIEEAMELRPDLAAERLREKTLRQNVGMERAGYWPSLSFNTAYQWEGQSNDWRVGTSERFDALTSSFELSWPIFEGFKTHSRVRQARAKLAQHSFKTREFEDTVVKEIRDSYDALLKAREGLRSQQKFLATARRATAIAGERFRAGLLSQLELNDAITARAQAEQNYLRAAFDCLIAEAGLERAQGR